MRHQLVGQLVVVGEERRHVGPERNARGAGERREIENQFRVVLVGKRERVGEDQPPFGVGIADLDGDALARGVDVARPEGGAGNRILHRRDQDAQPQAKLARHDHMRERERSGRAAHVLLHIEHGGLGLDVEPAGIEADALADERDARIIHITPGQIDQARLPCGGAADRMNEREILPQQIVADRGPGAGAVLGGKRARGLFEIGRSHVVRRRVDEVAHQRDRFDHALEIFAVEALRQIELDLAAFGLVVARKAISAERESERREPRVVRIVGKTVDAARQLLRQPAGQEQIPCVACILQAEQDAA